MHLALFLARSMNIPHAIDIETQVRIMAHRAATNAARGRYKCYGCGRDVHVVLKSKYNRVHFKHYPNEATGCSYSKNQDLHTQAKELVVVAFENALNKLGSMPIFQFQTPVGVKTVLPIIFGSVVKREWTLREIGRRPDVTILDANGNLVLAIEIKHKNAVNAQKCKDLIHCWWVEVDAKEVMENEFELKIIAHGNFPYQLELLGHQNELFSKI